MVVCCSSLNAKDVFGSKYPGDVDDDDNNDDDDDDDDDDGNGNDVVHPCCPIAYTCM